MNSQNIQICMPDRIDLSFRRPALRSLRDFLTGAAAAILASSLLLLLLVESARRGVSSAVFRYVGF
jgi:hypothetical protein